MCSVCKYDEKFIQNLVEYLKTKDSFEDLGIGK
jgi:hypothetical protein